MLFPRSKTLHFTLTKLERLLLSVHSPSASWIHVMIRHKCSFWHEQLSIKITPKSSFGSFHIYVQKLLNEFTINGWKFEFDPAARILVLPPQGSLSSHIHKLHIRRCLALNSQPQMCCPVGNHPQGVQGLHEYYHYHIHRFVQNESYHIHKCHTCMCQTLSTAQPSL